MTGKRPVDTNVSKRYPNGRTLETEDKYLPVKKGKSIKLKNNRRVVIIDSNSLDEFAILRLTTQSTPNTTLIATYNTGNKKDAYFKHIIEIKDFDGNPIKADGIKFIENPAKEDVSKSEVNKAQQKVYSHSKQAPENKKKLAELKSRKKP